MSIEDRVRIPVPVEYRLEPLTGKVRELVTRIRTLEDIIESIKTVREDRKNLFSARTGEDNREEAVVGIRETHRATHTLTLDKYLLERERDEVENTLALAVSKIQAEEFPIPLYREKTLGKATYLGQAESGTADWHTLRQNGIGGSQVLSAAGLEEDGCLRKASETSQVYSFQDVLAEKTTDPDSLVSETSAAAERGHLWEPVLLDIYRRHTGANVCIGKQTWRGSRVWQVVNVDGIILDAKGRPEGLIECKNSNSDYTWRGGVPLKYRAQLLYYMDATGLDYGDIIYRINGDVFIERIHRGERIDLCSKTFEPHTYTISDILPILDKVWEKVSSVQTETVSPLSLHTSGRRPEFGESSREVGDAASNLWALLHHTFNRGEVANLLSKLRKKDGMSLTEAVHTLLREHYDRNKLGVLVGVDGETAAIVGDVPHRPFLPAYSDWIESGVALIGPDGSIVTHHRRHGADSRILEVNGTGAEHVHGISPKDIEGLPRFIDDHQWLRDLLEPADVIVAHHMLFEKAHLRPIMYDIVTDKPWLDTQWLVKHFVPSQSVTDRNTLQDFVTNMGGEYTGAHRAYVDARMMMESLMKFLDTFPDL